MISLLPKKFYNYALSGPIFRCPTFDDGDQVAHDTTRIWGMGEPKVWIVLCYLKCIFEQEYLVAIVLLFKIKESRFGLFEFNTALHKDIEPNFFKSSNLQLAAIRFLAYIS